MESTNSSNSEPLRGTSFARSRWLAGACCAVFVLASSGIYLAESARVARRSQRVAEAVVWVPLAGKRTDNLSQHLGQVFETLTPKPSPTAGRARGVASDTCSRTVGNDLPGNVYEFDLQEIAAQLLSNANLQRAAPAPAASNDRSDRASSEATGMSTAASPERPTEQTAWKGRVQIIPIESEGKRIRGLRIRCTGTTDREALQLANNVARTCLRQIGETLRTRFGQLVDQAQTATEQARTAWHAAQARLEEFVDQHFLEHAIHTQGTPIARADASATGTGPATLAIPATIGPGSHAAPADDSMRSANEAAVQPSGRSKLVDTQSARATAPSDSGQAPKMHATPVSGSKFASARSPENTEQLPDSDRTESQQADDELARLRQVWEHLQQLRRHRVELLETRTANHPEILALESKIAELEEELSGVTFPSRAESPPPQLAAPANDSPQPSQLLAPPPRAEMEPAARENAPDRAKEELAAATYRQLKRAAEQAEATYTQRSAQLRQIWRAQTRLPAARMEPARLLPAPTAWPVTALPFALGLGLISALGMGLICGGASIDPPLDRPEQVERAAELPVVGVLPKLAPGRSTDRTDPRLVRRTLLTAGAIVLIVAVAASTWHFVL